MRAVNLLPRDAERSGSDGFRTPLLVAAGAAAAVTAVAVVLSFSASGAANERRDELASLQQTIARVPKAGPLVVSPAGLVQERTDRVAALAAALSTRVPFDRLLRELSLVLPDDAWLTGISASAPPTAAPAGAAPGATPPAASAAGQGVTIQGATYSQQSVARVLARLAILPTLDDVLLATSARVEPQSGATGADTAKKAKKKHQKPVVAFTIEATIRSGSSS